MARRHPGIPVPQRRVFSKSQWWQALSAIDADPRSTARVLAIESQLRQRIEIHFGGLPTMESALEKFKTNPFVLMIHCKRRGYSRVSELESDILPAKLFSSMETSAGRMIEAIALPAYGWSTVPSEMHSSHSALDGKKLSGDTLCVATLKSGPQCLNDEMSENLATSIVSNYRTWAQEAGVRRVSVTYGVLYGTPCGSNKKDWHILRNVAQQVGPASLRVSPEGRWFCSFECEGIEAEVTVRIGADWWSYLADGCLAELCVAMIRACVRPGDADPANQRYAISDLSQIVSLSSISPSFNSAILQRSQLPWLLFLARHFCDSLEDS